MALMIMFVLRIIALLVGFGSARELGRELAIEGRSVTGVGALLLYLAWVSILAFAWFQLLSTLIAPLFLSTTTPGITSPAQLEQRRVFVVMPTLFRFGWAIAALVLVVAWRKAIGRACEAAVGRCELISWQRIAVLGALAGLLQQLLALPQSLIFDILRGPVPIFPLSPAALLVGVNAVVAVLLVLALILARRSSTSPSSKGHE